MLRGEPLKHIHTTNTKDIVCCSFVCMCVSIHTLYYIKIIAKEKLAISLRMEGNLGGIQGRAACGS